MQQLLLVFTRNHGSHIGGPKQRNSGHVGGPKQSSGNLILFLCKCLLLFPGINMATGHTCENHVGRYCLFASHKERKDGVGLASFLHELRKAHSLAGHQNASQNVQDVAGSWLLQ